MLLEDFSHTMASLYLLCGALSKPECEYLESKILEYETHRTKQKINALQMDNKAIRDRIESQRFWPIQQLEELHRKLEVNNREISLLDVNPTEFEKSIHPVSEWHLSRDYRAWLEEYTLCFMPLAYRRILHDLILQYEKMHPIRVRFSLELWLYCLSPRLRKLYKVLTNRWRNSPIFLGI